MRYITKGRECRGCKKIFNVIRGLMTHDHLCCSDACFLKVGKIVRTVAPGMIIKPKRSFKQKKRKEQKKRRTDKHDFYRSQAWLELRYAVIRNYGRECMACGETRGSMHVDHIKPRSLYPELALAYTNLQVLCKGCNLGKVNHDDKDFRTVIVPLDTKLKNS